ncbi:hypothetical protein HDU93_005846 [Gonapodya sp. JEL0774]|nr:hypothetical protein HDU93_005846 [Gonapodya sp. JEL0774]
MCLASLRAMDLECSWVIKSQRGLESLNTTFGLSSYYSISINSTTGLATSSSAWPTLDYLVSNVKKRVVVAVASVDAAASTGDGGSDSGVAYNVSRDARWTFSGVDVGATPVWMSGGVGSVNCSYPVQGLVMVGTGSESSRSVTVPAGSKTQSWSFASVSDPTSRFYSPLSLINTTACGFSPLVQNPYSLLIPPYNTTSNVSSSTTNPFTVAPPTPATLGWDPGTLASAVWSWDWGMPVNNSGPNSVSGDGGANCAAMQRNGRWTLENCNAVRLVACQRVDKPEDWLIPTTAATYIDASKACPSSYLFSVPRTPQQNQALLSALLALPAGPTNDLVLIDYNDLASNGCWVVGQKTTEGRQAEAEKDGREEEAARDGIAKRAGMICNVGVDRGA